MTDKVNGRFIPPKDYLTRNEVVDLLRNTPGLKPHARLVILGYAEHLQYRKDGSKAIEQHYIAFPSQETVAEFAGVNKSTVSTYTKSLKEAGWLKVHGTKDVPIYDRAGRQIGQRVITLRAFGAGAVTDDLKVKARGRAANLKNQPPSNGDTVEPPSNGGRDTPQRQLKDPSTVVEIAPNGDTVTNNHCNSHSDNHCDNHSCDSASAPSQNLDRQANGNVPASLIPEGNDVAGGARIDPGSNISDEDSFISKDDDVALLQEPGETPLNGDTVEGMGHEDDDWIPTSKMTDEQLAAHIAELETKDVSSLKGTPLLAHRSLIKSAKTEQAKREADDDDFWS